MGVKRSLETSRTSNNFYFIPFKFQVVADSSLELFRLVTQSLITKSYKISSKISKVEVIFFKKMNTTLAAINFSHSYYILCFYFYAARRSQIISFSLTQ